MKSGKYTLRELWADGDAEQFVVPELQRDYVWTSKQIEPLLGNLLEAYKKYLGFTLPQFDGLKENQIKELEKIYRDNNCSCNIGFIYAYYDADVLNRYFLIDGQQRMTTIYLLMAYLAHCDKTSRDKFVSRYFRPIDSNSKSDDFRNHKLKLDYRVREVAHEFLQHLIFDMMSEQKNYLAEMLFNNQTWDKSEKDKEENITAALKKIPWYHLYYRDDVTIRSFVSNLHAIHKIIKGYSVDFSQWFSYLEDYIEFWYFDTNQSSQGEELYIYMNSRGEQLSYNENRRPDFLSSANSMKEKESLGNKWDDIQNFFWRNRGHNPSADKGFNFFLRLVEQLNIGEQDEWYIGKVKYATDERVQGQLKSFIQCAMESSAKAKTQTDDISEELEQYYSDCRSTEKANSISKAEEKWADLFAYYQTVSKFAVTKEIKDYFPIELYLQGIVPDKTQREFLVFIALLIVFKAQEEIDINLLKRCRLYFENLMRQEEIENEPTIGSRALFKLARYVGEKQDFYALREVENKLLISEEKQKLEYLAQLDDEIADGWLEFFDEILRDDKLLRGKIYLLLYAMQDVQENNPFEIIEQENFKERVKSLKDALHESFKSQNIYNAISFGQCFRYYSVQRTTYPYIFETDELAWHRNFYNYTNKGDVSIPNPYIVSFIKNDFKPKDTWEPLGDECCWRWLQKLFMSEESRKLILDDGGKKQFGVFGKKIYFHGGHPLFAKVCSFDDRIKYSNTEISKDLIMDYDDEKFILKIDGENDLKNIPIQIQDDGSWNFEELNDSVAKFKEEGKF